MASAKITDQCLWLAHIEEGDVKRALQSVHAGGVISMLVDREPIDFQRMATGKDGRPTNGFNPVGENLSVWRDRYVAGMHQTIDIDFAGRINAGD